MEGGHRSGLGVAQSLQLLDGPIYWQYLRVSDMKCWECHWLITSLVAQARLLALYMTGSVFTPSRVPRFGISFLVTRSLHLWLPTALAHVITVSHSYESLILCASFSRAAASDFLCKHIHSTAVSSAIFICSMPSLSFLFVPTWHRQNMLLKISGILLCGLPNSRQSHH